jgi:hypothetical protein
MQPLQKDGGEKRLRRVLLAEVSLASLPPIFLQGKNEQCVFFILRSNIILTTCNIYKKQRNSNRVFFYFALPAELLSEERKESNL